MSDRLPRSNSQSQLPNYGQGQSDNKKDVDKKKDGAPAQSDKNTGQGHSDKNKAAPQMKSKEEKKVKAPSESNSDDGGVEYGANFANIMFGGKQDERVEINTFERMFLGAKPSQAAQKFKNENESSSEDDVMPHQAKMPKSPRQQQSDHKEKSSAKKVPKLSLPKLGNALGNLAPDRREMTISPRKTNRETHRNTQDSTSSTRNTASTAGTTTTNTTATTAHTAVGNAAILHTTSVVTAPLWQPASPRSQWNTTSQLNPPATANPKDTNIATTDITTSPASWTPTSPRSKNSSNTQSPSVKTKTQQGTETKASVAKGEKDRTSATVKENTAQKTAAVKERTVGSVYADDLSEQSIKTINLALSGTIVSGADLAELLVCFQSCGYKKPLAGSSIDSILRLGMTVKNFPDSKDSEKTSDVNIIEKVSEPFIKKYYDTPKIEALRIAAMQKYDEGNLKVPDELKKKNAPDLRDIKTYSDAMRPLVKMVSKEIMGELMNLSDAPMHDQVKELLKGIDACVIKWSKESGGIEKEKLISARKSAISAYIATRSFMKIWIDAFAKDPELKKYIHMTAYLTTMLTTRSDKFFYSVMSNAVDQDNEQRKLLEESKNAIAFSSLGKPKKVKGKQFANPEQRAERRAIKKEVDNFLSQFDESLFDSNFSQYLQTIVASSKENTLSFRTNPAQFALDNLDGYWFSIDSTDGGDLYKESATIRELEQLLKIKIDSDKADDSGETTTSTEATSTTTTTNTNPTQASSEEDTSPRKQ